MTDSFTSSDTVRSGALLKHAQTETFEQTLSLEHGELPGVTVVYETYGELRPEKDNVILICQALSGDSHVARHDADDDPGWWDIMVGSGKPIDTDHYFVICPNVLGGCRGTTGPNSINPSTGKPYGRSFPAITVNDMVDVQRMLLGHLGIERLMAVIGGSLGGHQVLTWATRYPAKVGAALAIATSVRLTSQALAFDVVARNAIIRDSYYYDGQYYDKPNKPDVGLALARMLGHITYLSIESMHAKFDPNRYEPREIQTEFEKKFSVGSYLAYQGHKFVERFDANSYLTLSLAMDLFNLGEHPDELREVFSRSQCRWLVMSFTSDWLFPAFQSMEIVRSLIDADKPVTYCNVNSSSGHDAFLLDNDLDRYGELVRGFLKNADPAYSPVTNGEKAYDDIIHDDPTSIFHAHRLDYDLLLELIEPNASVLDLGCGNGGLLTRLRDRGHKQLMGVELDEPHIIANVKRGFDVLQHDLNEGLPPFTDNQFDYVILSQTLQAVDKVEKIIDDILRVGRKGIVSFPNFAYHKLRKMLFEQGRAPKVHGVLHYDWYNTPNRRYPSILDFQEFCTALGITIEQQIYLDTESDELVTESPNLYADTAIYVLSRSVLSR